MSSTAYRFPTLPPHDEFGHTLPGPPIYPEPSIYESIKIEREPGKGVFFDHVTVEMIMARPKWDFEEANLRLHKENKARERAEAERKIAKNNNPRAQRTPAKKAAAKKTTAKKARPTPPRQPRS